jgi:hypothetical protein
MPMPILGSKKLPISAKLKILIYGPLFNIHIVVTMGEKILFGILEAQPE